MMVARGYARDFAEACFRQIEGFGHYGFSESHSASFALLVYVSAWLKCHYPDMFCTALLNAQPMGFYAPAQFVRDALDHGVEVREVDVNFSFWDRNPRAAAAARVPDDRGAAGLPADQEPERTRGAADRRHRLRPYRTLDELKRYAGLERATLVRLAEAEALNRKVAPSTGRTSGLARVARVWGMARATIYRQRRPARLPPRRSGPRGPMPDPVPVEAMRGVLAGSGFQDEGSRKAWARLRREGIRPSRCRVLRLMRAHGFLAQQRPAAQEPRRHEHHRAGRSPGGTDLTTALTGAGQAAVVGTVDHHRQSR
jgi:hypothetical protein